MGSAGESNKRVAALAGIEKVIDLMTATKQHEHNSAARTVG